jgi:23S rRNA (cytosine1962-C5)-methyltransferase
VTLVAGKHKRAERGHPWIYSNEVVLNAAAKALPAGSLVTVRNAEGKSIGVATFNPQPLITCRVITRDWSVKIDRGFLVKRLERALALRDRLFAEPYYRLVHAEADGLPGLIVDRYGTAVVCQLNTAWASAMEDDILAALDEVLAPEVVVFRNDSHARTLEGLPTETRFAKGSLTSPLEVRENGSTFLADLSEGQKTGWFFDQRPNRAFVAGLAKGQRVLDCYSFTGGFGIQAAVAGAAEVTLVDRSEPALALAKQAAALNGVGDRCKILRGEVFETLEKLAEGKERFDVVILDPPAFVKSKKDLGPGSRGYRKMARLGAALVAKGGIMLAASCSHNMPLELFAEAVRQGVDDAGRVGRILYTGFAGPDHPTHPALPESAYLKAQVLALD